MILLPNFKRGYKHLYVVLSKHSTQATYPEERDSICVTAICSMLVSNPLPIQPFSQHQNITGTLWMHGTIYTLRLISCVSYRCLVFVATLNRWYLFVETLSPPFWPKPRNHIWLDFWCYGAQDHTQNVVIAAICSFEPLLLKAQGVCTVLKRAWHSIL